MRFISVRKLSALAFGVTILTTVSPAFASTSTVKPQHHSVQRTGTSPAQTKTCVIEPGDTLWKISKKFHVSLPVLTKANAHVNPTDLLPGHSIVIPAGSTKSTHQAAKKTPSKRTVRKEIRVIATAYTNAQGNLDATGHKVKFGTIAVDPKVIPLGSKVRITGMSFSGFPSSFVGQATDTGGDIKGDHVDIYLPVSEGKALDFGVKHVTVSVL